ncbi:glycoside hydrolase family 3 N-terminal domain-containing protein [Mucisphaera calidilacus]|uniref:Xylan 1,4-beta-xylosidase n=1 Tax=Mucisphaera calidilacus TaxID=2527982 RepID=A0A518BYK0_9BACT|nr:glycoside hydrolase family 3 N-terminal domain-containing protein [Mucisphaera calidilacus]QDU72034.1 Xylan 1,4-beta-xylosidase precursor [Mucisphaera calidilacus]
MSQTETVAYLDETLPVDERVRDLMGRMTLKEKCEQMLHWTPGIERLGVPEYDWWNECLHGVGRAGKATVFPQAIGLGASFDPDFALAVAKTISLEARAKHHAAAEDDRRHRYQGLTFWTPNINIFRDPRWGRGQETYGEDPCLTALLGRAFVRGLQGEHADGRLDVSACAKHFAVHSGPEADRHHFDAVASPKDLWETYLPAFETLVEAGVESVMGAYNRVNGEPACGSKTLLVDILRGRWGFQGHVVSDCWAIKDFHEHHEVTKDAVASIALALKNGCDLNCGCVYEGLLPAVQRGAVTEEDVDRSLERLLRTRFKLGMFDSPSTRASRAPSMDVLNQPTHRALAREAAARSCVLVKNEGDLLPLGVAARKILVCGPGAASVDVLLGNYYGCSSRMTTILEGIVDAADPRTVIEYRPAVLFDRPNDNSMDWVSAEARKSDVVIAALGMSPLTEGEEGDAIASAQLGDREAVELPEHQMAFVRRLAEAGTPVVVLLTGGAAMACPELHELATAVMHVWYPGEAGGEGIADVLFGAAEPGGRMPVSAPMATTDLPAFEDYAMAGRTYRYAEKDLLYPFGFGLGYTRYAYQSIDAAMAEDGSLTCRVRVKNVGDREGTETVQVYLAHEERAADQPVCWLGGVGRITAAAGAEAEIEVRVERRWLETVDDAGVREVRAGRYRVIAAGAAPLARSVALGGASPVEAVVELS